MLVWLFVLFALFITSAQSHESQPNGVSLRVKHGKTQEKPRRKHRKTPAPGHRRGLDEYEEFEYGDFQGAYEEYGLEQEYEEYEYDDEVAISLPIASNATSSPSISQIELALALTAAPSAALAGDEQQLNLGATFDSSAAITGKAAASTIAAMTVWILLFLIV